MANILPGAVFAYEFASRVHRDQIYHNPNGDEPYINHLFRVACHFQDETLQIIGVLHDILEDQSRYVNSILLMQLFGIRIPAGVVTLTRLPGENYLEHFIPRIVINPDSAQVKLADLDDNIMHCRGIPERQSQLERYLKAQAYIREHIYG